MNNKQVNKPSNIFSLETFLILVMLSLLSCKKDDAAEIGLPPLKTCIPVDPMGGLTYTNPGGPYTYRTKGGGTIVIDPSSYLSITHNDYTNFKIEFWGDVNIGEVTKTSANHENLNGKHIKDRIDTRRTIIYPDGAKVTFIAKGKIEPLISVSIYEGSESHHINMTCNTVEYSSSSDLIARKLDEAEADGETGTFEFTSDGLVFVNIYTEEVAGVKVESRVLLGEIKRANPTMVNDYFDDPRLGQT